MKRIENNFISNNEEGLSGPGSRPLPFKALYRKLNKLIKLNDY